MKIAAIVQSRMGSSRLPGKIMKPLPVNGNKHALDHVFYRLQKSRKIDEIIIATTKDSADEIIVETAKKQKNNFHRGSVNNVLERYYETAKKFNVNTIVRVTSDCPCIDPEIVDKGIEEHLFHQADFTFLNPKQHKFLMGLGFEIFHFDTLEKAYKHATKDFEKEHVGPYIYFSHPEKFKIHTFSVNAELPDFHFRVTLDTQQDYITLSAIFDMLYSSNPDFRLKDLINFYKKHSWIQEINKNIEQKKVHKNIKEEIDIVMEYCQKQDLHRMHAYLKKHKNLINYEK